MNNHSTPSGDSEDRDLRRRLLATPPEKLGFTPNREFPQVFGVLTDWNLGDAVASIAALRNGTASLYTTADFGIVGGEAHEAVRIAAIRGVRLAGRYVGVGEPVDAFPYPDPGQVFFYLLTHDGVRRLTGDEAKIAAEADPTLPLFEAAQVVLTELRRVSEEAGPEPAGPTSDD